MSNIKDLTEKIDCFIDENTRIDKDNGTLNAVCAFRKESRNNRVYLPKAVTAILGFLEGNKCFQDHGTMFVGQSVENLIGEFHNSIFGKERILVNGEEVSSIKSMTGTEHNFTVTESGEAAQYKLITGLNFNGVAINLYRNGNPVIESPTRGRMGFWLVVSVAILVAALIYLMGKGSI